MPRYTREDAERAVAASNSYAEALRRLEVDPHGGNHRVFRRWVDRIWQIPTDHFDPSRSRNRGFSRAIPLESILVENSRYSRGNLKARLLQAGLIQPVCELCGQGENWRGRRMALILDHINGVRNDNRLENLRMVCPNCAATLDTHCGRKNRMPPTWRNCLLCGKRFVVKRPEHRYCSRGCGTRHPRAYAPRLYRRKADRPPYEQLMREIAETGYLAVGRKYGVSDNAVRKWVRWYELERDRQAADAEASQAA